MNIIILSCTTIRVFRIDYDSFMNDSSIKGEFVRLVKADDIIDEDTKAAVISIGINALAGEDYI